MRGHETVHAGRSHAWYGCYSRVYGEGQLSPYPDLGPRKILKLDVQVCRHWWCIFTVIKCLVL